MHLKSYAMAFAPAIALTLRANAQSNTPSSWPHVYSGIPSGDYGPDWQTYFQVTEPLPNVTWPLGRNWAGNIPVQRKGHPNDTLFFWAFESSHDSFTAENDQPWAVWLSGGPGASSLAGLLFENGPVHVSSNYSVFKNEYAWTNVADYIWVDQPVGTGFSTADSKGYVFDEYQMGFLENLVKVFPNLVSRPLYITGESYAGTYIPYIVKAYFEMDHPPVKLAGIAIGNGLMGSQEASTLLPVVSVLETYPQIIGYDPDVLAYFREQSSLCGYDLILQYPQPEPFPTLTYVSGENLAPSDASSERYKTKFTKRDLILETQNRLTAKLTERDGGLSNHEKIRARNAWKRSLADRTNGSIDSWYGCDLFDEMVDYAINFTFPWSLSEESGGMFDVYNVPDALNPEVLMDASVFLNDPQSRAAIHAPTSKNWSLLIDYPFGNKYHKDSHGDPSSPPMAFLTELATNMTAHDIKVVIYSGNDDSLLPHFGSQVAIQNTTFGGIRGFTRKPETPWFNDNGEFAGIVHQERGWTYALIVHAGHLLAYTNPISALTLAREFIFGDNQTGFVTDTSQGSITGVGGEIPSLGEEILSGQVGIYYGSAKTESTYSFPTSTVEVWAEFMATVTPLP